MTKTKRSDTFLCTALTFVWIASTAGCAGSMGESDSAAGGDGGNQGGGGGEESGNNGGQAGDQSAGQGGDGGDQNGGEAGGTGQAGAAGGMAGDMAGSGGSAGSASSGGSGGTANSAGSGGTPGNGKPRVFVTSDLTRPGAGSDPDDVVTAAAMLLLMGEFDLQGINVGAQPQDNCSDAATWSNNNLGKAYTAEVARLRAKFPTYPASVTFKLSSFCNKSFSTSTDYKPANYPSLLPIVEAARKGPLYWLSWGELSEVAAGVKWMLENEPDTLKNVTVISHWTIPDRSNCNGDSTACDWIHARAKEGKVKFHELGPIGQTGVVEDSCNENSDANRDVINNSQIGKFMEEKWSGAPDLSDGATYLVVMGYGGGVSASLADGTYNKSTEAPLCQDRGKLWTLLEARAKIAAGN